MAQAKSKSGLSKRGAPNSAAAAEREIRRAWTRWRWRRFGKAFLLPAFVIALLIALDQHGWLLVRDRDDLSTYHGRTLPVTRVISGMMLEVDVPDVLHGSVVTRIRLWGVTIPDRDSTALAGSRGDVEHDGVDEHDPATWPIARHAAARVQELIEISNERLRLEIEPLRTRDPQGHVMVHAILIDERSVSEVLLREGLAMLDEHWPHNRMIEYAQAEQAARSNRRGLWR